MTGDLHHPGPRVADQGEHVAIVRKRREEPSPRVRTRLLTRHDCPGRVDETVAFSHQAGQPADVAGVDCLVERRNGSSRGVRHFSTFSPLRSWTAPTAACAT